MERNVSLGPPSNALIDLVTEDGTTDDLIFCSSFAESAFNPIVDLCTQGTGGDEIAPISNAPSVSGSFQTGAPIPAETLLRGHFPTTRKVASNRIRQQRHRAKIQQGKIASRNEIAELVSNFIAPNQGRRQKNESLK